MRDLGDCCMGLTNGLGRFSGTRNTSNGGRTGNERCHGRDLAYSV
jgi:hypothetical protein